MKPYEIFRDEALRRLAEHNFSIPCKDKAIDEVWDAIASRCEEVAKIASEQWLDTDLLDKHLKDHTVATDNNGDLIINGDKHLEDYFDSWISLSKRMRAAIENCI